MQQTTVDGRYNVLHSLGSGGMGQVFLAQDEVLGREVALKVLWERLAESEEFVERFRREARSVAALSHPNIVSVYDQGQAEDGTYYIAMEHVSGGTLKERIVGEGPLDDREAADVAIHIAAALGAAHGGGVIHRDIKPHNILLTDSGEVKVVDFGIARAVSQASMTGTSFILGTAHYLSPEQAKGEPTGPASDLYALGVVLYEMLTGVAPYEAESPIAVALKHVPAPPASPRAANPEVSEGMAAVVPRLLSKDPADRHADADELLEDLRLVREGRLPAWLTSVPKDGETVPESRTSQMHSVVVSRGRPGPPARGERNTRRRRRLK
ncbi:MAG: protein kinase domain-containing protein [Rubrobacteraceae bacterium]